VTGAPSVSRLLFRDVRGWRQEARRGSIRRRRRERFRPSIRGLQGGRLGRVARCRLGRSWPGIFECGGCAVEGDRCARLAASLGSGGHDHDAPENQHGSRHAVYVLPGGFERDEKRFATKRAGRFRRANMAGASRARSERHTSLSADDVRWLGRYTLLWCRGAPGVPFVDAR
jgi:hypothetical protein